MLGDKGLTHLIAYFEGLRTNRRPQPDQHLICRHCQLIQGGFKYPSSQTAPAGMGCGNAGTSAIAEQHWQAVGGHHRTGNAWRGGPTGIGADHYARIGVSQHSLYKWIKAFSAPAAEQQAQLSQTEEMRRLKAEVKRLTEERDILKKAAAYFAKG